MKASDLLNTEPSPESEWVSWHHLVFGPNFSSLTLLQMWEWLEAHLPNHITDPTLGTWFGRVSPEAVMFLQTDDAAAMIKLYHESK